MANNGKLLLIGGGLEPKPDEPVFTRFIKLAGGNDSRIGIIPTASNEMKETLEIYENGFKSMGVRDIIPIKITNRRESGNKDFVNILNDLDAVFITGGDQLRLTSIFGGSIFLDALNEFLIDHIVGGTSAGAAAVPDTMISWGDPGSFNKGLLQMSPGLGIVRDMVIDTHFIRRGRITRLLHMVAENPGILGIGLSEATAMLLETKKKTLEVLGQGSIIIVDGRKVSYSNISQIPEGKAISVEKVLLHALSEGHVFNYETHEIINSPIYDYKKNIPKSSVNQDLYLNQ
ncbi:MAG: cyanophycinase [Candidatus Hodarchaeales archaeon]|jgi:cyanophycinase